MPIGYLVAVGLVAVCTWFALAPPRPRRSSPRNVSFWLGFVVNELPFVAFYWLLASSLLAAGQGDLASPVGWAAFGLAALTTVGIAVVVRRGLRARPVVERALYEDLGTVARPLGRPPFGRILFAPLLFCRRDVERVANIAYGDEGDENLLDLYRHRGGPRGGPILIHLHGGAFVMGKKSREARPLVYRLASQGWVCVSANYRLRPAARFPDQLVDVKKVVAWAREHAEKYGADPNAVFVAGSSAGGHLASLAALTPNDPAFQPGFESVDTSVTAAISLHGYYGSIDGGRLPSSPMDYVREDAPPFFVAHGDQDTVVLVDDARRFVERLRSTSSRPVVYAELPGAQHAFDLFHSIRCDTVVAAVEAFAAWVGSPQGAEPR